MTFCLSNVYTKMTWVLRKKTISIFHEISISGLFMFRGIYGQNKNLVFTNVQSVLCNLHPRDFFYLLPRCLFFVRQIFRANFNKNFKNKLQ